MSDHRQVSLDSEGLISERKSLADIACTVMEYTAGAVVGATIVGLGAVALNTIYQQCIGWGIQGGLLPPKDLTTAIEQTYGLNIALGFYGAIAGAVVSIPLTYRSRNKALYEQIKKLYFQQRSSENIANITNMPLRKIDKLVHRWDKKFSKPRYFAPL